MFQFSVLPVFRIDLVSISLLPAYFHFTSGSDNLDPNMR